MNKGYFYNTIASGTDFSLVISTQFRVFSVGYNNCGQLGHGDRQDKEVLTLVKSLTKKRIVFVAAGDWFSMMLSHDGQVFGCGDNGSNELGLGDGYSARVKKPTLNPFLKGKRIIKVACGGSFAIYLSSDGVPYGNGLNSMGQIGLGKEDRSVAMPTQIPIKDFIVNIESGYNHTLYLNRSGKAYMTGNNQQGQLGLLHCKDVLVPTLIKTLGGVKNYQLSKFGLGDNYTIFCYNNDKLLQFGSNYLTGSSTDTPTYLGIEVKLPSSENQSEKIVKISSVLGGDVFILNRMGKIFTYGPNPYSQMGCSDQIKDRKDPEKRIYVISGLSNQKVVNIDSGGYNCLFLCENGTLYASGRNYKNRLGCGELEDVDEVGVPMKMIFKENGIEGGNEIFCYVPKRELVEVEVMLKKMLNCSYRGIYHDIKIHCVNE